MKRPTTKPLIRRRADERPGASSGINGDAKEGDWRKRSLRARPGFLIRRIYQIHVALFMEECREERVTPVQYSVLTALDQLGTMDQATLSRAVALDRTNVADVVARLESRRLLKRRPSPTDGRMMLSSITDAGRSLLTRLETAASRASSRTLSALPEKEKRSFTVALEKLIEANEKRDQSPVKLKTP